MKGKITFAALVERIADDSDVPKKAIHGLLKEAVQVIDEGLTRDGKVSIAGLGIFELKRQPARTGRNPRSGEMIEIPEHNRVIFKPAADLRRFINREYEGLKPEMTRDKKAPGPPARQKKSTALIQPKPETPRPAETRPVQPAPKKDPAETTAIPGQSPKKRFTPIGIIMVLLAVLLLGALYFLMPFEKTSETPTVADRTHSISPAATPKSRAARELDQTRSPLKAAPPLSIETGASGQKTQTRTMDSARETSAGNNADSHKIEPGDSFWTLAMVKYADPYLWPFIYRINADRVPDPDALEIGSTVLSPSLEGTSGNLSAQDRLNLADGYMQVYLAYRRIGRQTARHYLWAAGRFDAPGVMKKYENRIHEADRRYMSRVKGTFRIK